MRPPLPQAYEGFLELLKVNKPGWIVRIKEILHQISILISKQLKRVDSYVVALGYLNLHS